MVSAYTFNVEDEQELVFSSSEDESSDFESFDLDEMPLSYFASGKFEAYCTLRNAPYKVSLREYIFNRTVSILSTQRKTCRLFSKR